MGTHFLDAVLVMYGHGLDPETKPEFEHEVERVIHAIQAGQITPAQMAGKVSIEEPWGSLEVLVIHSASTHDEILVDGLLRIGDAMARVGVKPRDATILMALALRARVDGQGMSMPEMIEGSLVRTRLLLQRIVQWSQGAWPHPDRAWVQAIEQDAGPWVHGRPAPWGDRMQALMAAGIAPTGLVRSPANRSPLHAAVSHGLVGTAAALVDAGLDPAWIDESTGDTLFAAVSRGPTREKALMGLPVERLRRVANHVNKKGQTPLHQAAAAMSPTLVRYLLEECGAVPAPDARGKMPWEVIRRTGPQAAKHLKEMLALLASSTTGGIDPQVRLTMACRSLVTSEVTAALAEGARADHVDERLRTPLHLVARTNKENNSPDKPAQQAALVAAQEQCVRLLLDAGAKINARDDEGNTPLHHAASNRSAGLVGQLLDAGADATLANHKDYTPLTVRHPFYHSEFPEEEGSPATRTAQALVERLPLACLAQPDPAGRLPLKAWRQMPFMQTRLVAHALNQVLPPTSGASQTKRRL